jgi:hypothetical protein
LIFLDLTPKEIIFVIKKSLDPNIRFQKQSLFTSINESQEHSILEHNKSGCSKLLMI